MKRFSFISVIVVIFDRLIKILVQLLLTSKKAYVIKNFFYLTYVKNYGAALSMFQQQFFFLILIGIVASSIIVYYVLKSNTKNFGYALLFGGIIGNLIDRVLYHYVIDYMGFELFGYQMPIFNLADMAIVFGAIIIVLGKDETNKKIGSDNLENNS